MYPLWLTTKHQTRLVPSHHGWPRLRERELLALDNRDHSTIPSHNTVPLDPIEPCLTPLRVTPVVYQLLLAVSRHPSALLREPYLPCLVDRHHSSPRSPVFLHADHLEGTQAVHLLPHIVPPKTNLREPEWLVRLSYDRTYHCLTRPRLALVISLVFLHSAAPACLTFLVEALLADLLLLYLLHDTVLLETTHPCLTQLAEPDVVQLLHNSVLFKTTHPCLTQLAEPDLPPLAYLLHNPSYLGLICPYVVQLRPRVYLLRNLIHLDLVGNWKIQLRPQMAPLVHVHHDIVYLGPLGLYAVQADSSSQGDPPHQLVPWEMLLMTPRPMRVRAQCQPLVAVHRASTGLQMAYLLMRRFCWQNSVNTLRPRQNGRRFADTFKPIFLNENVRISIKISLKFVPKGQINNIPALVQIMAWRRPGDKPLSGPMMVGLPTHICVTRPQWVNPQVIFFFKL